MAGKMDSKVNPEATIEDLITRSKARKLRRKLAWALGAVCLFALELRAKGWW